MRHLNSLLLATTLLFSASTLANNLEEQSKALEIISKFADSLCKEIPLKGTQESIELKGSAKAELKGIVSKIAKLGFSGAAEYKDKEYQGLLQANLASTLKNNQECRLEVWNDLKDKLLVKQQATLPQWTEQNPPANQYQTQASMPVSNGYVSGTVITQCGCWGYVNLGQIAPDNRCASGRVQALACPWGCPMGGYAWGTRCL